MIRGLMVALACVMLTACAGTKALEPQGSAISGQQARIYLLRPDAWSGRLGRYTVSIDDKAIGEVAAESYVSADRAPGRHKISVNPLFEFAQVEHEFEAQAGRSYYFVVNAKASTTAVVSGGIVIPLHIPGTAVGKPLGQQNFLAGIYLAELDPDAGKAAIAALGKP